MVKSKDKFKIADKAIFLCSYIEKLFMAKILNVILNAKLLIINIC